MTHRIWRSPRPADAGTLTLCVAARSPAALELVIRITASGKPVAEQLVITTADLRRAELKVAHRDLRRSRAIEGGRAVSDRLASLPPTAGGLMHGSPGDRRGIVSRPP
jgi:hypothetical protein